MTEGKLNQIINREVLVDNKEDLLQFLDNDYDDLLYVSNKLRNNEESLL